MAVVKRISIVWWVVVLIAGVVAAQEGGSESSWMGVFDLSGLFYLTYQDGTLDWADTDRATDTVVQVVLQLKF